MHDRAAERSPTARTVAGAFLPEVEGLRGLAIALVVLFHLDSLIAARSVVAGAATSLPGAFVLAGHTGVSLFFVLSGFLLARPFLAEASGQRTVVRRAYFERRVLRIMPLYVVAVVVGTVLRAQHPADLLKGLPYLVFLNAIPRFATDLWPYNGAWWSLATEAQFYLLLPLLPLCVRSPGGRWAAPAALLAWALAYGVLAGGFAPSVGPGAKAALFSSVFGRAPQFAAGILGCWLYLRRGGRIAAWAGRRPWLARGGADLLLAGALVALGLLLERVVAMGYLTAEITWQWWHVPEGVLWTAVLLVLLLLPAGATAILTTRSVVAVGRWSYSLYLIHLPVWWYFYLTLGGRPGAVVGWSPRTLVLAVLVMGAAVAASALSYRLIERPFLGWKVRLHPASR